MLFFDKKSRALTILEVGFAFYYSLEEAFLAKTLKYERLKNEIQ